MSTPERAESYLPGTQDVDSEDSSKKRTETPTETRNASLTDSQDFHLVDTEEDESIVIKPEPSKDGKQVSQKLIEQQNSQRSPNTTECHANDKSMTENGQDSAIVEVKKTVINEPTEKIEKDVSSNAHETKEKAELSDNDEDEIIQGTPPHSYTPSKKPISNIEGASLKRKPGSFDEQPPAKVFRTTSMEEAVTVEVRLNEEESQQSCKSDDSYEDLFKNIQRNVVVEETQDPDNEFTQNLPTRPAVRLEKENDGAQNNSRLEEIGQQQDGVHSEKCCDIDKDENLNVSAKLTDTSANDSILVNVNSLHESDMQIDENNTSTEVNENIMSSDIITDKKYETDVPNKMEKPSGMKDAILDECNKTRQLINRVEPEKTVDNDEEISSFQTKEILPSDDLCAKITTPCKSRTSVELIYDGAHKIVTDEGKSKPEIVEIDEDGEKIVLDSSEEMIDERQTNNIAGGEDKSKLEVIEINDSHEDGERIVLHCLEARSEVTIIDRSLHSDVNTTNNETPYISCIESKNSSDFSYKTLENLKESSLGSKTDSRMMNGSSETKRSDGTLSVGSDTFSGLEMPIALARDDSNVSRAGAKASSFDRDPSIELVSISDHEHDANDSARNKSDLIHNAMTKAVQVEREIGIYVKLKCLLQIDESTKEFLSKELTTVQCEPASIEPACIRQKNDDMTSSLADLSDNKDSSPGSVNSNAQLYHLNPSRLSIMSSISSSSSASSAASLAAKLALKDSLHFSLPRGPAKHAKKPLSQEVLPSPSSADKQTLDESYERLTREWNNNRLLTTTILNCMNVELSALDVCNVSNERLDDHLQKIHSSTPEATVEKTALSDTPRSTRKGKAVKRHRSKMKSNAQTNGENKSSPDIENDVPSLHDSVANDSTPSRKRIKVETSGIAGSAQLLINDTDILANISPLSIDDLIGKEVFAKWSDNNYYPGIVTDRFKTKYKVNFYDSKSKTLIPEFVIPIPKTLREGLSVYATTQTNDYGSCGIIVDVQSAKDGDVYYTVETDEGKRLRVQVKNIFLSNDQAQVLKEEADTGSNTLPNTPKHLAQVSLDNMVDGKRRSKRIGTPIFSTPKLKGAGGSSASKTKSEPSVSGMASKLKREQSTVSEVLTSDSNAESTMQDENELRGVQREIIGTPYQQIVKGPQSRIKSKPRAKKRIEDEQTIATLGPIPSTNSGIFDGMFFILTCASLDTLYRYKDQDTTATETDTETDNEEDWTERPFVRDRLRSQIIAGGGKVYEEFDDIPKNEYSNTKLITNVPNTTAKSILCLSVGIPAYNHKWIIRCCSEVSAHDFHYTVYLGKYKTDESFEN